MPSTAPPLAPRPAATPHSSRRATSYDVARLAGVSQSAVSRALRDGGPVSAATRAKVRAAADELGYAPSNVARSLITRRSRTIGVVVTAFTARNFPDLLLRLGEAIEASGSRMLVFTLPGEDAAPSVLSDLLAYHVDGVLSCASLPPGMVEALARRDVPVVLYNREARGAAMLACDDSGAIAQLAAHLAAGGLARAAFIAGPVAAPVSEARHRAARHALDGHGHAFAELVHADYSYEGGHAAGLALLGAGERYDTVICANDAMALGLIDACRHALGLRVPEDVAVTGFDDVPQAAWPPYDLTTLRQPVETMTRAAIEMLGARIAGEASTPERRLVPATLRVRGSTRPVPTS